ncbi:LysR substrate-binding domain-containing protein [Micromonospora vinacea]|uniref:LysR substrate-binding domain-containing protein n=1 Tax=Micromonospora vinacea TaxID=709878 RepID=UPI003CF711C8
MARADASVRPGRRALRVDVHSRRIAPAVLLQGFHRAHPRIELDVVTLDADVHAAMAAVEAGTVDATFHAVTVAARHLPAAIRTTRVIDEHHELLVGPRHALANARTVTPAQLAEHRIWVPGMARGTERADYYDELAAAFGLTIDLIGPVFGNEALLAEIAQLATARTARLPRLPASTGTRHGGLAAALGIAAAVSRRVDTRSSGTTFNVLVK